MQNASSQAVVGRFFEALDELKARRIIHGAAVFCREHDINRRHLYLQRVEPWRSIVPPFCESFDQFLKFAGDVDPSFAEFLDLVVGGFGDSEADSHFLCGCGFASAAWAGATSGFVLCVHVLCVWD